MKVIFDVRHLYYLPGYLPVYQELIQKGHEVTFVFYFSNNDDLQNKIIDQYNLTTTWVESSEKALDIYKDKTIDWVIFGNRYKFLKVLHKFTKSAQLGHGIGPKRAYYGISNTSMTVRFVEGQFRLKKLESLFPKDHFVDVGYSKLDPLFNLTEQGLDLIKLGLDPNKKTILYAPTFNPSSLEKFPDNWPSVFSDYNILIKPHQFSLSQEKYKKHKDKLLTWSQFDNVYLSHEIEFNIIPFMKSSDILVSDTSSTILEFLSLNKPIILCKFLKLKWNYRGPLKYRYFKRMSDDFLFYEQISEPVLHFKHLKSAIDNKLSITNSNTNIKNDFCEKFVGSTDGKVSKRVVDYLNDFNEKKLQ